MGALSYLAAAELAFCVVFLAWTSAAAWDQRAARQMPHPRPALPRAQVDALARRARRVDPRGVRVVEVTRRG